MAVRKCFDFIGKVCLLLSFAGGFYFVSNNYFMAGGKITDFSFFAWGAMLALWGAALWNCYCREKPFLLMFALAATAVTAVFDCCRLLVYTEGQECYTVIYALMAAELALFAGMVYLRRREAAELFLGSLILSYFGVIFILPQLCPLRYIYMFAGVYALLWLIYRKTGEKAALCIAGISMAGVILIAGGVGVMMYLRLPGIRFYEAKITEPAKEVKVSIVIPVYNAEKVIERCLDSLRRQTLKDIEIIAVNDGSTDGTAEILARYAAHDARIRVIHQKNAYIGAARNRGLKAARGEYVGFVDSDDFVSSDYYESLYRAAKTENSNLAIIDKIEIVLADNDFLLPQTVKSVRNFEKYVWNKLYKRDFLMENHIHFTTYRTIYEDSFFAVLLSLYDAEPVLAKGGVYYYTKSSRGSVSTFLKPMSGDDELIEMLINLKAEIDDVEMNPEKKKVAYTLLSRFSKENITNYYKLIQPEDRKHLAGMCLANFDAEYCDFSGVEIYSWEDEKK